MSAARRDCDWSRRCWGSSGSTSRTSGIPSRRGRTGACGWPRASRSIARRSATPRRSGCRGPSAVSCRAISSSRCPATRTRPAPCARASSWARRASSIRRSAKRSCTSCSAPSTSRSYMRRSITWAFPSASARAWTTSWSRPSRASTCRPTRISGCGADERDEMERLFWLLALVVTFGIGWAAAGVSVKPATVQEVDHLRHQVSTLQARLRAQDDGTASRPSGSARAEANRVQTAEVSDERLLLESRARGGDPAQRRSGSQADGGSSRSAGTASPAPSINTALDRFYKYLQATTSGTEGRERWQRARELVEELRGMGDVAGKALMQVLASGSDSDERRAAARLLGQLQVPESLPLLRDIIEKDPDVLL